MMFVATVSIMVEVGLICAILFEHFKSSLLYSVLMAGAILHGVLTGGQLYCASLTFQIAFLAAFCCFAAGIKLKTFAADRIIERGSCLELRHCLVEGGEGEES